MKYNPEKHHRQSTRLSGYDYSQAAAYFVTICTQNRECLLGDVVDGKMQLNDAGRIVQAAWDDLPNHYPNVALDEFVVMPNHAHGIIMIVRAGLKPLGSTQTAVVGAGLKPAQIHTAKHHGLSEMIRALKTFSARRINEMRDTQGVAVWQRNYYEHIIQGDESANRIRAYIQNNPLEWALDQENPLVANPSPCVKHRMALR